MLLSTRLYVVHFVKYAKLSWKVYSSRNGKVVFCFAKGLLEGVENMAAEP